MSTTPPPPPPPSAPPPPPPMGGPAGFGGMPSQPVSPVGQPLAEAWMRILARILDGLIVGVVFGAILSGIVLSGDDSGGIGGFGGDGSDGKLYLLGLLSMAVGFVWDAVCTKMYGGTPMKLAFGMRVVRADTGGPVEWSHAIIRWAVPGVLSLLSIGVLGFLVGIVEFVVVIVSLVFLFTNPLRQAVWDQVAKTLVVKTR